MFRTGKWRNFFTVEAINPRSLEMVNRYGADWSE
jgi:hypothetical protein